MIAYATLSLCSLGDTNDTEACTSLCVPTNYARLVNCDECILANGEQDVMLRTLTTKLATAQ